ncbi:MAG: hypothetical protein NZM28_05695, partial [Fimbriimonadales bacterium]|nr:hypothetical protein [Fimbriimonadales bacterium]
MGRRWLAWLRLHKRALAWRLSHRWERTPIGVRFALTLKVVIVLVFAPLIFMSIYSLQQTLQQQNRISQARLAKKVELILERELIGLLRHTEDYSVWNDARAAVLRRDKRWLRTYLVDWMVQ